MGAVIVLWVLMVLALFVVVLGGLGDGIGNEIGSHVISTEKSASKRWQAEH